MSDYDYLFKVIVVGDGAVGKTALTIRFAEGRFQDHYKMTIGVDFAIKMVSIGQKRVKLQIWDTGGQERFSYIRPLYYKGAMGVVYVFDITNRSSYDHLSKWYKEVSDYCGNVPALLVANKCDLPDKAVTSPEAEQMAASLNGPYYEASAKTGDNVDDLFTSLARILIAQEGVTVPAPAPAPARIPTPTPIVAPTPAPLPAPVVTRAPQTSSDTLEEALAFLNTPEEEPAPAPAPAPSPVRTATPQPLRPTSAPTQSFTSSPTPTPFSSQPAPATRTPAPAPASPSPFTSFLTPKQEPAQESTFIPFIPQAPKAATGPAIKPVPASPQQPISLSVAPKAAPAAPAPQEKACPNCSKVISGRWKFCTFCGTPLR